MMRSTPAVCAGIFAAASLMSVAPCFAQASSAETPGAAGANADMTMPDDMGAPLPGADRPAAPTGGQLSVNMPIAAIASNPHGKAVLEQHLPGLCERPEYMMFKSMSLAKLATMSSGRISPAQVSSIQAELVRVDVPATSTRRYGLFTEGSRSVRYLSHAVYKRVLIVVGSL